MAFLSLKKNLKFHFTAFTLEILQKQVHYLFLKHNNTIHIFSFHINNTWFLREIIGSVILDYT